MTRLLLPAITLLAIGCSRQPVPQPQAEVQQFPASPAQAPPPQAPPPAPEPAAPEPPPAAPHPADIVIPSGTPIRVRLNHALSTRHSRPGQHFTAVLVDPIRENSRLVVPKGTTFTGHVTEARPSGRLKGRAVLGVTLDSFQLNGARYPVITTAANRSGKRHRKRNLALIGGGAGTGALIGGIAGGGAGALIGAGAGAAAGTVGAAFTGKKQIALPAETILTFRLEDPVEL